MPKLRILAALAVLALPGAARAQAAAPVQRVLLRPARVLDGVTAQPHEGWAVLVEGDRIAAAGPAASLQAAGARVVELPGTTLLPGLIEGHRHLLLHPYNETSWDDQVLRSRWRCAWRGRRPRRAPRCWPASPPCATWAPRAPAMPTWG